MTVEHGAVDVDETAAARFHLLFRRTPLPGELRRLEIAESRLRLRLPGRPRRRVPGVVSRL